MHKNSCFTIYLKRIEKVYWLFIEIKIKSIGKRWCKAPTKEKRIKMNKIKADLINKRDLKSIS